MRLSHKAKTLSLKRDFSNETETRSGPRAATKKTTFTKGGFKMKGEHNK